MLADANVAFVCVPLSWAKIIKEKVQRVAEGRPFVPKHLSKERFVRERHVRNASLCLPCVLIHSVSHPVQEIFNGNERFGLVWVSTQEFGRENIDCKTEA